MKLLVAQRVIDLQAAASAPSKVFAIKGLHKRAAGVQKMSIVDAVFSADM